MRITVSTPDLRFPIVVPVPLALAGVLVSILPERALDGVREGLPAEVRSWFTKPILKCLFCEGKSILREYRGLEILSVISAEGETVSVRL